MEDKGEPTPGHKTKIQFCLAETGTSCFTIFGKDEWEEEIYRAQTKTPIILLCEIWVTQHPCCSQNISSTNLHLMVFHFINITTSGLCMWSITFDNDIYF